MRNVLMHESMDGMPNEQKAVKAIEYTLFRIRDEEKVANVLGFGTQAFDLLTEAYASLSGQNLESVRRHIAGLPDK